MRQFAALTTGALAILLAACQSSAPQASQPAAPQSAAASQSTGQKAVEAVAQQTVATDAAQKIVDAASVFPVSIKESGESVTITNTKGESTTFGSKLPDELKSFPVPGGFSIDKESVGSMSGSGATTATATWTGNSTVNAVTDFYTKLLSEQGWTKSMAMSTSDGSVLAYEKSDKSAWITISQEDGKTRIVVLYGTGGQTAGSATAGN